MNIHHRFFSFLAGLMEPVEAAQQLEALASTCLYSPHTVLKDTNGLEMM